MWSASCDPSVCVFAILLLFTFRSFCCGVEWYIGTEKKCENLCCHKEEKRYKRGEQKSGVR